MSNIWEEEFRDQPVEFDSNGGWKEVEEGGVPLNEPNRNARAPQPRGPITPLTPEEETNASYFLDALGQPEYDEDAENEQVLADANLRLEQGNLYKIIMNSDLFVGQDDIDQRAVNNVQREVRRFARERMEIMLGMRAEKTASAPIVSSPFNSVEVEALKMVAAKITKGASAQAPAAAPSAPAPAKRPALNPISVAPSRKQAPVAPKTPVAPLQRKAPTPPAPAANKDDYKPLEKPIHQMTAKELEERNAEAAKRQRSRPKNPGSLPMPSPDEQAFMVQQQIASMPVAGQNAIAMVMNAMNKSK